MYDIQQSTTAYELLFLLVLSSDHISPATGKSPTVTIRKAGGSFGSPSGAVSEIANGWYTVAGNATDTNTLGPLLLHATEASSDPVDVAYNVVKYNPQDGVRLGLTALPNAAAEAAGGLFTRGTGAGQINQDANGRIDANLKAWLAATPAALTANGYAQAMLLRWLTDDAAGTPAALSTASQLVQVVLKRWLTDDGAGTPDALVSGKVAVTVSGVGFTRAASADLQFVMEDSLGQPVTGLLDTDFTAKQESLDGVAFADLSGTIAEVGNGLYTLSLTSGEWDASLVTFYFAAPGAVPRLFSVKTVG